jgi:hypothetical protein
MIEDRRSFVWARIFATDQRPDFFPELHDEQGLAIPWLRGPRRHFGLAFSGGGTRSSAATLGQLRGLKVSGLLEKVGYISAVSGGGWTGTPYVFLPPDRDEDLFLGTAKEPQELTLADLEQVPAGSMAAAIVQAHLIPELVREGLFRRGGDETAGRAVGNLFLEPFGLDDLSRFLSFHSEAVGAVLAANARQPGNRHWLEPEDFYTVRPGRPFLILGTTVTRIENTSLAERRIPCELTPLYAGMRKLFSRAGVDRLPIGGGYVETLAFDSRAPVEVAGDRVRVEIGEQRFRLTLSDMLGASGALLREIVDFTGLNFLGLPEFRHWPLTDLGEVEEQEYGHGDGALLENLGIMPLLARQVRNIIVFVNASTVFHPNAEDLEERICGSLEPLFRKTRNRDLLNQVTDEDFDLNVVFEEDEYEKLVRGFYHCHLRGEPLVHWGSYQVRENRHFQVRPYEARIAWVYIAPVPRWMDALPADVAELFERSALRRFPNFLTTFENGVFQPISLEPVQVNALAHLSCYAIRNKAQELARFFEL